MHINASNGRFVLEMEKSPDGHSKKHPCAVLFITLNSAASIQTEKEVRLHDFERLVAMFGDTECELLGNISEFYMQFRFIKVKFCSDSAD